MLEDRVNFLMSLSKSLRVGYHGVLDPPPLLQGAAPGEQGFSESRGHGPSQPGDRMPLELICFDQQQTVPGQM